MLGRLLGREVSRCLRKLSLRYRGFLIFTLCPTSMELGHNLKTMKLTCMLLNCNSILLSCHSYRYTGSAWPPLVQGGGSWEVRGKGNLSPRTDNGRINSSPTAAVSPVIVLQHGVAHTITIPGEQIFQVCMAMVCIVYHNIFSADRAFL